MFAEVDKDGSGSIEFPEFLQMMTASVRKDDKEESSKIFKLFDTDSTGMITLQNLKAAAQELGENLSEEDLQYMIECVPRLTAFMSRPPPPTRDLLTSMVSSLFAPARTFTYAHSHADKSSNNAVSFDDFYRLMQKRSAQAAGGGIDDLLGDDD
jgi:hypothetical protein